MSLEDEANAGPPGVGSAPASDSESKFIGVSDDYVRVSKQRRDDLDNPMRRVAPGVIRGGRVELVGQRPLYSQATFDGMLANMPPEEVWVVQQKLARAGLISPKARITPELWDRPTKNALREAMELANTYAVDLDTALDMLSEMGGTVGADGKGGLSLGGEAPFTGTKTRTNKMVRLTNPTEARKTLRNYLRDELGRAPSSEEMETYIAALNGAENANAIVETENVSYVDDEVTGTSSVQQGGLDAEGFTEEFVQGDPELRAERGSFLRDTDYYNAAMSVLGEGGGRL